MSARFVLLHWILAVFFLASPSPLHGEELKYVWSACGLFAELVDDGVEISIGGKLFIFPDDAARFANRDPIYSDTFPWEGEIHDDGPRPHPKRGTLVDATIASRVVTPEEDKAAVIKTRPLEIEGHPISRTMFLMSPRTGRWRFVHRSLTEPGSSTTYWKSMDLSEPSLQGESGTRNRLTIDREDFEEPSVTFGNRLFPSMKASLTFKDLIIDLEAPIEFRTRVRPLAEAEEQTFQSYDLEGFLKEIEAEVTPEEFDRIIFHYLDEMLLIAKGNIEIPGFTETSTELASLMERYKVGSVEDVNVEEIAPEEESKKFSARFWVGNSGDILLELYRIENFTTLSFHLQRH